MDDILINSHQGYPWVLALEQGVVVRKSMRDSSAQPRRVRITLPMHCGRHAHDDPKELAHMRRVIAQEEKING